MKVLVDLDKDGYVDAFCLIGAPEGFIEAEVEDFKHFDVNFSNYKYEDSKLVYKPRETDIAF